ncbi:hypothetical protein EDC01DRAFT_633506 [Geopyxis carbonaria]|nr:hypothetical protein EDC01DRAFT_633506 [Geopyxis carbonaria]
MPNHYDDLLCSTRHIFFLGTPHQGAGQAAFLDFLTTLQITLKLGTGNKSSAVRELQRWSDTLLEITADFSYIAGNLSITTFFENKTTHGVQVVKEASARLGLPTEKAIMLNADHHEICKYENKACANYRAVLGRIVAEMDKLSDPGAILEYDCSVKKPSGTTRRNANFVGRQSFMRLLDERLLPDANGTAVLYGLGGVGKTQVALEYCHKMQENANVFWVHASNDKFIEDYAAIAVVVGLPIVGSEQEDLLARVQAWLECGSHSVPWFLVLDNADDPEMVHFKYLPRRGGRLLFTTRFKSAVWRYTDRGNEIHLDVMKIDEARDLFLKMTGRMTTDPEIDNINGLIRQLGLLPIAINQAAAYIHQNGTSIETYLKLYSKSEAERVSLLSKSPEMPYQTSEVPPTVMTTWKVSFDFIEKQNPHSALLLYIMSHFHNRTIPYGLLCQRKAPEALINERDMIEAIGLLKAFALVSESPEERTYDLHPLVSLWARLNLRLSQDQQSSMSTLPNEYALKMVEYYFIHNRSKSWRFYEQALPHAIAVIEIFDGNGIRSAKLYNLRTAVGHHLCQKGSLPRAEKMQIEAVELAKCIFGMDNPKTLTCMKDLAVTLQGQGRLKEAASVITKVLKLRKDHLGENHPDTLSSMNTLAGVLREQGKHVEAMEITKSISEVRKRTLGDRHPKTLSSMSNLAIALREQGKLDESKIITLKVLGMREQVLGEDHPDTLKSMTNLASILGTEGRLREVAQIETKVLEKRKKLLGGNHPDTLQSIRNLAGTLGDQGKFGGAVQLERQVWKMRLKILGEDHPDTLSSMYHLASTLRYQGNLLESIDMSRRVIDNQKRVLGKDHPDTLASISNLAGALGSQGELEECIKMEEMVLKSRKKVLGEEHPDTLLSMSNIACTLADQHKIEESISMETEVLGIRTTNFGSTHPDTLTSMVNLAKTLGNQQGKLVEAISLLEEVVRARSRVFDEDHPDMLSTMAELQVLQDLMKKQDLEEAVAISKQRAGPFRRVRLQEWSRLKEVWRRSKLSGGDLD